ncbi:MAG: tyrosine-type recombinase/integrase [Terriglobia bacterium]|nr:tyrosine-type recombinase/integrase [Terriglobia bacterium]
MLLFRSDPFGGTHELLPCGLLGGDLVKLFRKNKSKYYWYDFTVRGERYRGSTKETNETRAQKAAALKLAAAIKGSDPLDRKPPTVGEYSKDFLQWVETGRLEADSRRYYRNGWRLLDKTKIAGMRMDRITKDEVEKLQFPGSASNGNNALRTLRRMYSKAKEDKRIFEVPDFALFKEHGRSLRLNDEAERRLSAVAEQPLKDIIVVMRDTGMRNARELYCMRVENVDFDAATIFTPDSKTESGRRFIPMSSRVKQILSARCEGRSEGWVWISRYKGKHIGEGMVYRQWVRARQAAGLPRELVLYCARHDFGSFVLSKTGNLKAVMNAMGHGDVRSAMVYQHPEGEIIRNALNARHISRPTVPNDNQASA